MSYDAEMRGENLLGCKGQGVGEVKNYQALCLSDREDDGKIKQKPCLGDNNLLNIIYVEDAAVPRHR